MNFFVIVGVIAVLVALNFARLNILAWLAAWWVGMYVMFAYGVNPPLPSSIVIMFMAIVTLALFAYMSANSDYLKNVKDKSVAFMTERKYLVPLAIVLIALPSLVAFRVYSNATQAPQSPANTRTIHPPPPTSITFNGKNMDLVTLENPYRPLKESDPAAFQAHSDNGRRIYYENCVIGGRNAFVVPVWDWDDFPAAVQRKMLLEVSGASPPPTLAAGPPRLWRTGSDDFDCYDTDAIWGPTWWFERRRR